MEASAVRGGPLPASSTTASSQPQPLRKEWRAVPQDPDHVKSGQSDERTIYEEGGETLDVDFCAITIDNGGSDLLQHRIQEISRQQEELHRMEVGLRVQAIVQSEILEVQRGFEARVKEHAAAAAKLKDGKVSQLEHVFNRGSKVRFMVIPDTLKNAPMFKRLDVRIRGKGSALGVGRGRAVAMHARVVPMENVNGRKLVEGEQLCERRNGRGVDLNRNWSVEWGKKENYDPLEENPGMAPFSEPEAQIMRKISKSFNPHIWMNVHSGMQDGKVSQLEHVFNRGSKVRFMVIPDMLKNAPMFKRLDVRIRGKGSALGVGRGRAVAMHARGTNYIFWRVH